MLFGDYENKILVDLRQKMLDAAAECDRTSAICAKTARADDASFIKFCSENEEFVEELKDKIDISRKIFVGMTFEMFKQAAFLCMPKMELFYHLVFNIPYEVSFNFDLPKDAKETIDYCIDNFLTEDECFIIKTFILGYEDYNAKLNSIREKCFPNNYRNDLLIREINYSLQRAYEKLTLDQPRNMLLHGLADYDKYKMHERITTINDMEKELNNLQEKIAENKNIIENIVDYKEQHSIYTLDISDRYKEILTNASIHTVESIAKLGYAKLKDVEGLSNKSARTIIEAANSKYKLNIFSGAKYKGMDKILFDLFGNNKNEANQEDIKEYMSNLTEREIIVINAVIDCKTFTDIAKLINVSNSRASQVYAKAIRKMKRRCISIKSQKENVIKYETENKDALDTTIEQLELSVRSYNALKRAGYETVRDIVSSNPEKLIKTRNLGRKSFEELKYRILEVTGGEIKIEKRSDSCGQQNVQ